MSGFVTRTLSRNEAIGALMKDLCFPWPMDIRRNVPLTEAVGFPVALDMTAPDRKSVV